MAPSGAILWGSLPDRAIPRPAYPRFPPPNGGQQSDWESVQRTIFVCRHAQASTGPLPGEALTRHNPIRQIRCHSLEVTDVPGVGDLGVYFAGTGNMECVVDAAAGDAKRCMRMVFIMAFLRTRSASTQAAPHPGPCRPAPGQR